MKATEQPFAWRRPGIRFTCMRSCERRNCEHWLPGKDVQPNKAAPRLPAWSTVPSSERILQSIPRGWSAARARASAKVRLSQIGAPLIEARTGEVSPQPNASLE
jgi:hypothetical protein